MNKMDMSDIVDRGKKKALMRHMAAMQNWNQVDTEIEIGKMYEKAKAAGIHLKPEDRKQMEALYGPSE